MPLNPAWGHDYSANGLRYVRNVAFASRGPTPLLFVGSESSPTQTLSMGRTIKTYVLAVSSATGEMS